MTGIIIDPEKHTVGTILLPNQSDRVLHSALKKELNCPEVVFQLELWCRDVLVVDYRCHEYARNLPFKFYNNTMVFGKAILLGADRVQNVLQDPALHKSEVRGMVTFLDDTQCKRIMKELFSTPSSLKIIPFAPF
jgi:hypothetical protein